MRRERGFRIGRKLVRVFTWVVHRRTTTTKRGAAAYRLLEPRSSAAAGALSKLRGSLGRLLKRGVAGRSPGYVRVGQEPAETKKAVCVPKGHLAVYVGEKEDGSARRVVVPVIYFNHPLFASLLREAETVYGFNHPGGIQIPCRISEFENVQSRIAATGGGDNCNLRRRSWRHKIKW